MTKRTAIVLGAVVAALLGVIILTLYLIQSQQDVRSRASQETPATTQQESCPTPSQVSSVKVEFPNCVGSVCNFTQASCSWDSVSGATKYQIKVSQVESGETVKDDQVDAAVTRVEFPITQGKTYRCDVSVINSCGNISAVASDQLLCQADALIPTTAPSTTPNPTPAPTTFVPTTAPTIIPTTPPVSTTIPTAIPPTMAPTGNTIPTIGAFAGIFIIIAIGTALMIL